MDVLAGSRRGCDGAFPGGLHAGFGAGGTDGFETGEGFDQYAVTRGRLRLQPFHRPIERALHDEAERDHGAAA